MIQQNKYHTDSLTHPLLSTRVQTHSKFPTIGVRMSRAMLPSTPMLSVTLPPHLHSSIACCFTLDPQPAILSSDALSLSRAFLDDSPSVSRFLSCSCTLPLSRACAGMLSPALSRARAFSLYFPRLAFPLSAISLPFLSSASARAHTRSLSHSPSVSLPAAFPLFLSCLSFRMFAFAPSHALSLETFKTWSRKGLIQRTIVFRENIRLLLPYCRVARCVHACLYIEIRTRAHAHTHTHACIQTLPNTRAHTHTRMLIHAHTHTHTQAHTQRRCSLMCLRPKS